MNSDKNKKVKNVGALVLAGGLGTRMKSEAPKALSNLLENPLIFYSIESLMNVGKYFNIRRGSEYRVLLDEIGIVIGHKGDLVEKYFLEEKRFKTKGLSFDFASQKNYLGTGDAVLRALESNMFSGKSELLILPCDMPLIDMKTYIEMMKFHLDNGNDLTVLSVEAENPYSYGRILRDDKGFAEKIVEEKELCDYPPETAEVKEINSGIYIIGLDYLRKLIKRIKPNNRKKEFYLTDIVNIFYKAGLKTRCYKHHDSLEFIGVNSKPDIIKAQKILQGRVIDNLAEEGVNFISTDNIYIGYNVKIGKNSIIYPGVFISGESFLSNDVVVENGCVIKDSVILEKSEIKSYSVIEKAAIMNSVQIGPFARLRPDSSILEGSKIGNFVEVKKSTIGKNSKASHLSYIGDAEIGAGVNIGAGVITCNYDGVKKHKTVIGDGCFIGSDSQLVAPVNIGAGSYVGAGSTIVKDVPADSLAVSRAVQKNIPGWVSKRAKKKAEAKDKRITDKKGDI